MEKIITRECVRVCVCVYVIKHKQALSYLFQVCQKRQGFPNPLYFNCGTQDSADFLDDGQGRLMLQYSADTDNSNVLR